jgi:hypothetical protein
VARKLLARQIVKNFVTNWQVLEIVEEILSIDPGTNFACAARLADQRGAPSPFPTMRCVIAAFSPGYVDNALRCDNFCHFFDATRHPLRGASN